MPSGDPGGTCLVAVVDSGASVHALVWAYRRATLRGMCVEVLTVWPGHRSPLIHEVPGHFNAARWSAHAAQLEALRSAAEVVREEPVTAARLENADAGAAIVRASAHCELVVLGAHEGDLSHSLTDRILAEAVCEVVVVGSSGDVIATNRPTLTS